MHDAPKADSGLDGPEDEDERRTLDEFIDLSFHGFVDDKQNNRSEADERQSLAQL